MLITMSGLLCRMDHPSPVLSKCLLCSLMHFSCLIGLSIPSLSRGITRNLFFDFFLQVQSRGIDPPIQVRHIA